MLLQWVYDWEWCQLLSLGNVWVSLGLFYPIRRRIHCFSHTKCMFLSNEIHGFSHFDQTGCSLFCPMKYMAWAILTNQIWMFFNLKYYLFKTILFNFNNFTLQCTPFQKIEKTKLNYLNSEIGGQEPSPFNQFSSCGRGWITSGYESIYIEPVPAWTALIVFTHEFFTADH